MNDPAIKNDKQIDHLIELLRMSREAGDLEGLASAARALRAYVVKLAKVKGLVA